MNLIDLTGQTFGRLTVLRRSDRNTPQGHPMWTCLCTCGNQKNIRGTHLRGGACQSCGCFALETRTIHNLSKTNEHAIWRAMLRRCDNPSDKSFKNYGGRGIQVCSRWRDFKNFYSDMGARPSLKHSIDRINNDGNYEPGNCRWATAIEQVANRRPSKSKGVQK